VRKSNLLFLRRPGLAVIQHRAYPRALQPPLRRFRFWQNRGLKQHFRLKFISVYSKTFARLRFIVGRIANPTYGSLPVSQWNKKGQEIHPDLLSCHFVITFPLATSSPACTLCPLQANRPSPLFHRVFFLEAFEHGMQFFMPPLSNYLLFVFFKSFIKLLQLCFC